MATKPDGFSLRARSVFHPPVRLADHATLELRSRQGGGDRGTIEHAFALRVGNLAPLVAEDWSLRITEASPDGKVCRFALHGSVTGEDGSGVSTDRFVPNSGRVVIEPEDWNVAYCVKVFNRSVPENHTATWQAVLRGVDKAAAPRVLPNTERYLTVAQGLAPANHVLELRGARLAEQIESARFYCPRGATTDR